MDLDGLVFVFSFGMWCCLYAEFYILNGPSIMESVLRFGPSYNAEMNVYSFVFL